MEYFSSLKRTVKYLCIYKRNIECDKEYRRAYLPGVGYCSHSGRCRPTCNRYI